MKCSGRDGAWHSVATPISFRPTTRMRGASFSRAASGSGGGGRRGPSRRSEGVRRTLVHSREAARGLGPLLAEPAAPESLEGASTHRFASRPAIPMRWSPRARCSVSFPAAFSRAIPIRRSSSCVSPSRRTQPPASPRLYLARLLARRHDSRRAARRRWRCRSRRAAAPRERADARALYGQVSP
jgi:hypothetical protein